MGYPPGEVYENKEKYGRIKEMKLFVWVFCLFWVIVVAVLLIMAIKGPAPIPERQEPAPELEKIIVPDYNEYRNFKGKG